MNGLSKVEIIKKYLYEREKNERFYETYLIKKVENTPNTRPSLTNTVTKPKHPVQTPTKQTNQTPTKQPATSTSSKTTKPTKPKWSALMTYNTNYVSQPHEWSRQGNQVAI